MSSSFMSKLTIVSTSLSLGLLALAAPASADIGWIVQSSSQLGGRAEVTLPASGDPNDPGTYVPEIKIVTVPQTDVGTSGDPNLPNPANSMIGKGGGYFSTTGNNFLQNLNFGVRPPDNSPLSALTVVAQNNGNWFPNADPTGQGSDPLTYGTAQPAVAAGKLQTISPLTGFNPYTAGDFSEVSTDNGRLAIRGLASKPTSGNIAVTDGVFNSSTIRFAGITSVDFNINAQIIPDEDEFGVYPPTHIPPELLLENNGTRFPLTDNDTPAELQTSTITRLGAKYVMTTNYTTAFDLSPLIIYLDLNMVAYANLRPGDVNFDGKVNISDIAMVADNWNATNAKGLGNGDATGNGKVDISDIAMIADNWNQLPPALGGGGGGSITAVPEPGSLLLLGLGAVSMLFVARRKSRR